MNYLFHLYLSGDDPDLMVGNLAGDFVKGPLGDEYSHGLRRGMQLHRRIDSFAQTHPVFVRSRRRLSPEFGLYRGILVDFYYDHFLTLQWEELSEEPLDRYLVRVRRIVEGRREALPVRLQSLYPYIFDDFIPAYRSIQGIGYALGRLSRRLRQPNPLPLGGRELERHYEGLRRDFNEFLPEIRREAEEFVARMPMR